MVDCSSKILTKGLTINLVETMMVMSLRRKCYNLQQNFHQVRYAQIVINIWLIIHCYWSLVFNWSFCIRLTWYLIEMTSMEMENYQKKNSNCYFQKRNNIIRFKSKITWKLMFFLAQDECIWNKTSIYTSNFGVFNH